MYQINPVDNFFFRSAVPFETAGESTLIKSQFPPYPTTYGGALKKFAVKKRIRIGFNGLALDDKFIFPKPLDLITFKLENDITCCRGMALEKTPLSSFPLSHYLCDQSQEDGKTKEVNDLYLYEEELKAYLKGNVSDFKCLSLSNHLVYEPKIGIAVDHKSKTVKEEHLYELQMVRPQQDSNLKLVADVKHINLIEDTIIKLGGESKMATIRSLDCDLTINPFVEAPFFKLYLATPALFKQGWLPAWINPDTKIGRFSFKNKSVKVKLISAAVGKKIAIGGFSESDTNQSSRPSAMSYGVPAGSVYYFKLLEGNIQDVIKLFHQQCISDYRAGSGFERLTPMYDRLKYCDRGFGYTLVGALTKNQEEMLK